MGSKWSYVISRLLVQAHVSNSRSTYRVVGEDTQSNNKSQDCLRNDLFVGWRVSLNPVTVGLETPQLVAMSVYIIEGTVTLGSQVCGCISKGTLGWHERSLCIRGIEVGLAAPRLHIGVSLIKQEVTRNNSNKK
jgi:hypothetical protein